MDMKETLISILNEQEININNEKLNKIDMFYDLLMEKNLVMDLTNITEPREVAIRHMADSLFLLKCAEFTGKKVLDIGTGAGFPGVPLLLAADDLEITMLDSTQKRIDFINESIEKIGNFPKATAIAGRAEEVALLKNHREKYDIVVSRAVAPMKIGRAHV